MDLKVKKMRPSARLPSRAHATDAGIDLCVDLDMFLNKIPTLVPSGIAVEIPVGYVGLVFPRSSTYTRWGIQLSNSVGVIDSDFRGEIQFSFVKTKEVTESYIPRGTRIAQLVIVPFVAANVVEVEELSKTERGEGGYGSTGK
jgi:dUTP pyrophosphatase